MQLFWIVYRPKKRGNKFRNNWNEAFQLSPQLGTLQAYQQLALGKGNRRQADSFYQPGNNKRLRNIRIECRRADHHSNVIK